jgi:hypothetical protein
MYSPLVAMIGTWSPEIPGAWMMPPAARPVTGSELMIFCVCA